MLKEISVLIPTYNVGDYIINCLNSVVNNTIYDKCEVFIQDDCSNDDTVKIIELFIEKNKGVANSIHFSKNTKNLGVAATRNILLKKAVHKYIAFVDSDDWLEPDYFENLYDSIEECGGDVSGCYRFDEYKNQSIKFTDEFAETGKKNLHLLLQGRLFSTLHCRIFRRQIVIDNDISFDEGINMGEDKLFCTKYFYYANKACCVEKYLYHYNRCNEGSICAKNSSKSILDRNMNTISIDNFLSQKTSEYDYEIKLQKALCISYCMLSDNMDDRKKAIKIFPKEKNYVLKLPNSFFTKMYFLFFLLHIYPICSIMRKVNKYFKK